MKKTFLLLAGLLFLGKIAAQTILVSSRNTHSVKQFDLAGNFIGDFVAAGSGGLSFPQEVVWHPDGFLLVTGRGNSAIKKYDGSTGAYLGNFTSGYALDNPTKMTIWQDSLLFVSQWGATKNKVVRFDLKTGNFVDEFTSVGVPNGCGQAWDAGGNLLVAQFGNGANGKIWKFDPAGKLLGDFISSAQLQGPVNLWFDAAGSLLVADWTLGKVLKFNGLTGAFESEAIAGLSNVEGFAFDSSGKLYLCDWTKNQVFRFDFSIQKLEPFITDGGLVAPNSILILEKTNAASQVFSDFFQVKISPNPSSGKVQVSYFLEKTEAVQLEILNESGQKLATVFAGEQSAGEHTATWRGAAGAYFLRLSVGQKSLVEPFLIH